MSMLNLNNLFGSRAPVDPFVLQSRANYEIVSKDVLNRPYDYPMAPLLKHAFSWFNFANDPSYSLQPSELVKWQLLCIAKSFQTADGKVVAHPELSLTALSPDDIALLYRVIYSFLESESNAKRYLSVPSFIGRHHISLIGDLVLNICETNKQFAQELKRSITDQQDPNSLQALYNRVTQLIDLFAQLQVGDRKSAVFAFLNNFYSTIESKQEWIFEGEFYSFLKAVDRVCPELEVFKYFFDFGMGLTTSVAMDLKGFGVLRDHFNTKAKDGYKYAGKLNDVILTNLANLGTDLKNLKENGFLGIKKLHVLNGGPEMNAVGGHYDPIFVRITPTATTLIITDSGDFHGKNGPSIWLPQLKVKIDEANLPNLRIITFRSARQSDSLSCGVTSWRDILESNRTDIFAYIDSLAPAQFSHEKGMEVVENFPPSFMKVKQSTSYIGRYEQTVPQAKVEIVASKEVSRIGALSFRSDKTLKQVVEAHTIDRQGSKVNFYLRMRAYKYFTLVMRNLAQTKLPA